MGEDAGQFADQAIGFCSGGVMVSAYQRSDSRIGGEYRVRRDQWRRQSSSDDRLALNDNERSPFGDQA